jgi:HJR/Mrr/RecB family endonuclease
MPILHRIFIDIECGDEDLPYWEAEKNLDRLDDVMDFDIENVVAQYLHSEGFKKFSVTSTTSV